MFPSRLVFPCLRSALISYSPNQRARQRFVQRSVVGGLLLLIVACTPLGGWLYDDPTFVLSELTVRGRNPSDTLELVLTACNRNDYPVEATGIEVQFVMQGATVGSSQSSTAFMLQTRDSTKLTVPLALPPEVADTGARLSYVMTGHTMLNTPIGSRRVEIYQKGRVSLKPKDEVAHITAAGRPCRPGQSTLPGYMPTPILIDPSRPSVP
jgi:Late embryogenesis abundant protein